MTEAFRVAMEAAGLPSPSMLTPDGSLHRFQVEGDRARTENGWYILYNDPPAGAFGCWKRNLSETWSGKPASPLTSAEKATHRARMEAARADRERIQIEIHAEARKKAASIWKTAEPAPPGHQYLVKKNIAPHGARVSRGSLVLSLRDIAGTLHGLQFVDQDGGKKYLTGTKKAGSYFALGGKPAGVLYLCEGFATGASIHQATGGAVAAAFDAGNLRHAAEALREKFPDLQVVVCADNDAWTKGNPGATKAREAAGTVGGLLALPSFQDTEGRPTDFNDLHRLEGLEEVRRQIEAAAAPTINEEGAQPAAPSWDDPLLFGELHTPEIPAAVLPSWLGDYAAAVADNTQTPPGLAVMLALAVVATCLQRRFQVAPFGDDYREPVNIWTVTALPPASRKTAVISSLTAPMETWEREEAERLAPEIRRVNIRRAANLKRIEQLTKKAAGCDEHAERERLLSEIATIEEDTPAEMRPPRLWTADVTPERLQMLLAEQGERMALLSDEGGIFEIMAGLYSDGRANLDVFLQAHAGKSVRVDRSGRAAYLEAPALSFGLAVQPAIISDFSQGGKKRFRGNGALARFLFCLPQNNIGLRDVRRRAHIPESVKAKYQAGILGLLSVPPMMDETGRERPRTLTLDADARESFLAFAQFIESKQGPGGDYEQIQDWTGKLPGAAVRIAGLFHVVEHGPNVQAINQATMEKALDLAELLIAHAKAAFDLMGADQGTDDARAVLRWIVEQGQATFSRRDCHYAMKGRFTKVERLTRSLQELNERGMIGEPVKESTGGRPSLTYRVNPAILREVAQ